MGLYVLRECCVWSGLTAMDDDGQARLLCLSTPLWLAEAKMLRPFRPHDARTCSVSAQRRRPSQRSQWPGCRAVCCGSEEAKARCMVMGWGSGEQRREGSSGASGVWVIAARRNQPASQAALATRWMKEAMPEADSVMLQRWYHSIPTMAAGLQQVLSQPPALS
jgi:hypothetical protein